MGLHAGFDFCAPWSSDDVAAEPVVQGKVDHDEGEEEGAALCNLYFITCAGNSTRDDEPNFDSNSSDAGPTTTRGGEPNPNRDVEMAREPMMLQTSVPALAVALENPPPPTLDSGARAAPQTASRYCCWSGCARRAAASISGQRRILFNKQADSPSWRIGVVGRAHAQQGDVDAACAPPAPGGGATRAAAASTDGRETVAAWSGAPATGGGRER